MHNGPRLSRNAAFQVPAAPSWCQAQLALHHSSPPLPHRSALNSFSETLFLCRTTCSARPHLTAGALAQPHRHPVFLSQAPVSQIYFLYSPFSGPPFLGPCVPCQWLTRLMKGLRGQELGSMGSLFLNISKQHKSVE